MIVTGIGSRPKNLPLDPNGHIAAWLVNLLTEIGEVATKNNWKLRSGAASGMDTLFESVWSENKEIFLPYKGFNGRVEGKHGAILVDDPATINNARAIASKVHPVWARLKPPAKEMHTRNVFQALGEDLSTPSDICIYYAPVSKDGEVEGGTRTAVVICNENNIPTYNLRNTDDVIRLRTFLDQWK